jgi:hypothetical protein
MLLRVTLLILPSLNSTGENSSLTSGTGTTNVGSVVLSVVSSEIRAVHPNALSAAICTGASLFADSTNLVRRHDSSSGARFCDGSNLITPAIKEKA